MNLEGDSSPKPQRPTRLTPWLSPCETRSRNSTEPSWTSHQWKLSGTKKCHFKLLNVGKFVTAIEGEHNLQPWKHHSVSHCWVFTTQLFRLCNQRTLFHFPLKQVNVKVIKVCFLKERLGGGIGFSSFDIMLPWLKVQILPLVVVWPWVFHQSLQASLFHP